MSVDNGSKDQEALAVAVRGLVNELKAWIASKLKHPAKATAYVFMGVIIIKSLLADTAGRPAGVPVRLGCRVLRGVQPD